MDKPTNPQDLTHGELLVMVEAIREHLWPGGDAHSTWSPDTVADIAQEFIRRGLEPSTTIDRGMVPPSPSNPEPT